MNTSTTAANDPVTGRIPNAWAAGRGDQAQSATFRALAWSQVDDSVPEPLRYTGDDYQEYAEPEVDSRPTVRVVADTSERPPANRYRRSTLLYAIAAGFVAAAVGGLVFTAVNTDDGPVTIPTKATAPATNIVNSQPSGEPSSPRAPIRASSPSPVKTSIAQVGEASAHIVPSSAAAPSRAFAAPVPELQSSPAPESPAPQAAAPEAAAPEPAAPEPAAPEFTAPDAKPPVWVPPISAPVVSVPEVTPQQVPHPLGPIHLPFPSGPIDLPTPSGPSGPIHLPTGTDVVIPAPAASAPSNPVLTLKPGVIIPTVIPTLSAGAGH